MSASGTAAISSVLRGHEKDLGGGLLVRRLLPAASRQALGRFIFCGHFGPTEL